MKSANLFTKVVAWLLCAMLVVGYLPVASIVADASADDWESDIDVVETEPPAGSSADNAILLNSLENTVTVEAGATVYYYGRFNGMVMTVNSFAGFEIIVDGVSTADVDGNVTMECGGNPRMPFTFAIKNNGAEANEYYVNFNYPEGSQMNPQDLIQGENTVTLEAGNDGYFFDFVAYSDGYVTFTISGTNGWMWTITNMNTYAQTDMHTSDDEVWVYEYTFQYNAEEVYEIMVNTFDPADVYNAPAGDITVSVSFKTGLGTEASPFLLTEQENYETIGAGETVYYYGRFSGMNMTVSGNEGFTVNYNGTDYADSYGSIEPIALNSGSPRMPIYFSITNNSEEEAGYFVAFAYPEGTMSNPQDLWENETASHTFEAGEGAYYYDYVGYSDGYLTFVITADCGWQYVINNVTAGVYGDMQWSDSDPVVNTQTFKYYAGEEYVIEVATYDAAVMWNTPAGTVNVEVIFVPGFGTEESPFILYNNPETVTIGAGETVYYQSYLAGMNLNVTGSDFAVVYGGESIADVDGAVSIAIPASMGRPMPTIFGITNNGSADAEYVINATYPVGSNENPAVAVIGDNAANIAAGSQGYVFTYTAEKDGDLTIAISGADGWSYVINNLTTWAYGDMQWSDSDPVVNPATIQVSAGDEIQIIVNGYDPENPWNAPAANLIVTLSNACAHNYDAVVTAPTTSSKGYTTYTCTLCGDSYVDNYKNMLPSGDAELRIRAYSLSLAADLTMRIKFRHATFAAGAYTNFRMEVIMVNDEEGERVVTFDENYAFESEATNRAYVFTGISPRKMNDTITIKLYGTFEGVEYVYTTTYSVATYCYNQLGKSTDGKLLTLLADLLNFGTAHQIYNAYNTENLVNAKMTDAQRAYASTYTQNLTSVQNSSYKVIDNPTVPFVAIGLLLSNKVEIVYTVQTTDLTGLSLHVNFVGDNGLETRVIDASQFTLKKGYTDRWEIKFDALQAKQMSVPVEATVYRDGVAVSNTFLYSIESYAQRQIPKAGENLKNLLVTMMYYGASAKAYFNK